MKTLPPRELRRVWGRAAGLFKPRSLFAPQTIEEWKAVSNVLARELRLSNNREVLLTDAGLALFRQTVALLPVSGSSFYRTVEALFVGAGIAWPRNCIGTNSLHALERLAVSSGCITFATRSQLVEERKLARAIPLHGVPPRTIGVKCRKDFTLPPIAHAFIEHLQRAAVDLGIAPVDLRAKAQGLGHAGVRWGRAGHSARLAARSSSWCRSCDPGGRFNQAACDFKIFGAGPTCRC